MEDLLFRACFLLAYFYLMFFYWKNVNGNCFFPTAINLFILFQIPTFVGTFLHADFLTNPSDLTRINSILLGMFFLVVGTFCANRRFKFLPKIEHAAFLKKPVINDVKGGVLIWAVYGIGLLSCAVGLIYVSAIGYNVPLALLTSYSGTGSSEVSSQIYGELRTSALRNPDKYVAPGYAAQFIKVLLPAMFYIYYFKAFSIGSRINKSFAFFLFFVCIYFLTVTGVRTYLIIFTLTYLALTSKKYGPFGMLPGADDKRLPVLTVATAFTFFAMFTLLGGRTKDVSGIGSGLFSVAIDFMERIFFVPADNQLIIMKYFEQMSFGWGSGFLRSLLNVMPGVGKRSLSNDLYEMLYGGFGNAPVDFWNSIWYDFGWIGIIFVPFLFGYFMQKFSIYIYRGEKTITRGVICVMASFALMDVSEPIAIFNNGVITLLIYYACIQFVKRFDAKIVPRKYGY